MALNCVTLEYLKPYLPAKILSFGYPDNHKHLLDRSELVTVDLFKHHGSEVIADLSLPWGAGKNPQFDAQFDLVLDCGTTEHCANPLQAFLNAASACKVGGHVFHHLPATAVNHGYWNISPKWFHDFYVAANGFVCEHIKLTGGDGNFYRHEQLQWPAEPTQNMDLPPNALTLFIARRTHSRPITLPRCERHWTGGFRRVCSRARAIIERIL